MQKQMASPTSEPKLHFAVIDYQYVMGNHLMH